MPHQLKRVVEGLVAPDQDVPLAALLLLLGLFEHDSPDEALGVELQNLRDLHNQILELDVDDLLVDSNEDIDQLLVADEESYDRLEPVVKSSWSDASLSPRLCCIRRFSSLGRLSRTLLGELLLDDAEYLGLLLVHFHVSVEPV